MIIVTTNIVLVISTIIIVIAIVCILFIIIICNNRKNIRGLVIQTIGSSTLAHVVLVKFTASAYELSQN